NVSTAAAFVVAAAGGRVAKHGNRAMSSACGSADVLEALGARVELPPDQVARCIEEVGFGFMFAPAFHPATRHANVTRREIGVRTAFNILGPLTNPAGATNQLMGVPQAELAPKMAAVLQRLGSRHALVVHGNDGLDELSLSGPSKVYELRGGEISEYEVRPSMFGLQEAPLAAIKGGTAAENASAMRSLLDGASGPLRDIVLLNSAAALVAADIATDFPRGIEIARSVIDSGEAARRLERFVALTASFPLEPTAKV
ncbi:MAG TPA: anthranilate phosphoribosyltransferase, partial [Dehalococcoidia bacterium]|nr:anthranilate phosphoribosyltransferase [Dehalococcoidia bacterium]